MARGPTAPGASVAGRWAIMAVVASLGCLFAWTTVTRALAHYYVAVAPAVAVRLAPDDPRALLQVSAASLLGQRAPRNLEAAQVAAKRALLSDPLQAPALRNLGLIAEAKGRTAAAEAIMTRAAMRGYRDASTQAWLAGKALRQGDLPEAFMRLDAVMRGQPDLDEHVFPTLAALAAAPPALGPLAQRLATNPPWRLSALSYFSEHTPDTSKLMELHAALVRLGRPPTSDESQPLLGRLTGEGRYIDAFRLWISLLPPAARAHLAAPYDGGFAGLPGPAPFNWSFSRSAGVTVKPGGADARGRTALEVDYPVASAVTLADQLLVLPPGAYRLSGRARIGQAAAGAQLVWTVQCVQAASAAPLAEARQPGDAVTAWTAFSTTFTIPADCPAQHLRLEGRPGDGFGDLQAWFGAVSVKPAVGQPPV